MLMWKILPLEQKQLNLARFLTMAYQENPPRGLTAAFSALAMIENGMLIAANLTAVSNIAHSVLMVVGLIIRIEDHKVLNNIIDEWSARIESSGEEPRRGIQDVPSQEST